MKKLTSKRLRKIFDVLTHPKKLVKAILVRIYWLFLNLLQVDKEVILFESNLGRNYSGNPKSIYEKFIEQGLDKEYKFIWILEKTDTIIPGNCIKARRSGLKYFYYMAIAGFWIFDCRQPKFIRKREECAYIQTWHGTPLKKLALDMTVVNMAGQKNIDKYKADFYKNTRTWDYLISQNSYSTEIFRRAFAFDKTMLEIGYPRNDSLINNNNATDIAKMKDKLGLPKDKKIILYAPTWRDDEYYGRGKYKFNLKLDLDLLMKELKDEYIIVLKLHYLISDNIDVEPYKGFAYLCTPEQDILELYLVSDLMITDYSSVMFDYSILKRPMLFFTYDLEKYQDELRGFYFDFMEEAPGPIVRENEELLEAIKTINVEIDTKYAEKFRAFNQKFNHLDDGKAAAKVVALVQQLSK